MSYTPTEFSTVEDKERFEAQFKKFVLNGFLDADFPKWFYTRLSMTFGHIAHYNMSGFYNHFFCMGQQGRMDFLSQTMSGGGYGDPAYTYSDVEKSIKLWLSGLDYLTIKKACTP